MAKKKTLELPDYTKDSNIDSAMVVKNSPINDFEYVDNIEFDQSYESVSQRKLLAVPSNTGADIFGRIESNRQGDEGYWKLILPDGFEAISIETFIGGAGGGGTSFIFGYMVQLPGAAPGGNTQFYIPGYISPTVDFDGQLDIGGSLEQWNTIYLVNAPVVSSDKRKKKNIKKLKYGTKDLLKLNPVTFKRKDDKNGDRVYLGFIAQEVKKVIPEAIVGNEKDGFGMTYDAIIPVLVNTIRELNERIVKLEKKKGV